MTSKLLHALAVPEDAQVSTASKFSRQTAKTGAVSGEGGGSAVEPVSLDPGQQMLQGAYRSQGPLSRMMATQFEELFDAGGVEYVPYCGREEPGAMDGYYALENVDVNKVHPSTDAIQAFDGVLTKAGTKKTHVRAVHTAPSGVDTIGSSEWSNDDPPPHPEQVCLPVDAHRPRWFDPVSGTVETAEPLNKWQYPETPGEFVNFRTYALSDASFYQPADNAPRPPALVYEYPYNREYRMDVRCWDTAPDALGAEKTIIRDDDLAVGSTVGGPGAQVGEATVGESPREDNITVASAWQHVYRAGHDFRGECVLDNGVLRLRFDAERGAIAAQRSRGHFNEWADQPLRPSVWALAEFDLTHVGLARVAAQVEFEHGRTGERYAMDVSLPRGYENAVFTVAQNQSGAPAYELSQKLTPVAQFGGVSVRVPNQRAGLVEREDLQQ